MNPIMLICLFISHLTVRRHISCQEWEMTKFTSTRGCCAFDSVIERIKLFLWKSYYLHGDPMHIWHCVTAGNRANELDEAIIDESERRRIKKNIRKKNQWATTCFGLASVNGWSANTVQGRKTCRKRKTIWSGALDWNTSKHVIL